jgi:cellulose synthase/poly-beta-1,6-N-acetylglucosamine synthase-like glycosyltransferase
VSLLTVSRGGKPAAQDTAVRATSGEVLAFSDANTLWRPDALRRLVSNFADRKSRTSVAAISTGRTDGTNREELYARALRAGSAGMSRAGSITGGVGPIYAVRRSDYIELDPRLGHDVVLPYLLVQRGRRAVVEPDALAWEKPRATSRTNTAGRFGCSSTAG